jgi:hypothetical protein
MSLIAWLTASVVMSAAPSLLADDFDPLEAQIGVYTPACGGWQLRISADTTAPRPAPESAMGVVDGDGRQHRRPLYPPADRSLIWTSQQLDKMPRSSFRPLVIAYNAPRFLLDCHAGGGALGHLYLGVTRGAASKWLHDWSDIAVRYVDGRMEYVLSDPAFPGLTITLAAAPLAHSVGLIVKVGIAGDAPGQPTITWAYGGAAAFFSNYDMGAKQWTFAPEQCAKDRLRARAGSFELRRTFDASDVITREVFSVFHKLPEWEAVIQGGSGGAARTGTSDPGRMTSTPAALSEVANWNADTEEPARVAVGELGDSDFVVVGVGGDIADALQNPRAAWEAALARNQSIAERVVVDSPDPCLNAAATMMAFATEGTWGDIATVHGGWSWRFAYLGWRTGYGPVCYGWPERTGKYIRQHATMGVVKDGDDAGGIGSMLEYEPGVFYNMNEVFFDHVRQYFDYTNDLELMREIFPVLEGVLAWESRRLQPDNQGLYESALNTWISDSHWYTRGQCTQASAYMLNAYRFVADLAARLGKDPQPFQQQAERIGQAMQDKLWMKQEGVFAEYLDTRGNRLLHPEPELATIYHAAEFGAADPAQIRQMLHWVDAHLRTDRTPNGGTIVWSSNWYPNRGRTYTHSTYEVAYGEELNLALTNYLAGRADQGYDLIRATFCGIFNGPTPGGLSCHAFSDGRQRANDEFADAISMWDRAVVEGLFGIVPKRPQGRIEVTPQFPQQWPRAAIQTPQFTYELVRTTGRLCVTFKSPQPLPIRFRFPLRLATVNAATIDGKPIQPEIAAAGDDLNWVICEVPALAAGTLEVRYTESPTVTGERDSVRTGPALAEPLAQSLAQPVAQPVARARGSAVWKLPEAGDHDLSRWTTLDLTGVFNDAVIDVPAHVLAKSPPPAPPASQVNFNYWKDHFTDTHHGGRIEMLSDEAWRAKVGPDGIAWTRDGIPFKSAKAGNNIAMVSVTAGYEPKVSFPAHVSGTRLYLMISGATFPAQSHVTNVRVTLHYADGTSSHADLVSPFGIGDCWTTWCGRYHDTAANGFENLGGRHGVAGSADVPDMTQPVDTDTEAHLVPLDLKPNVELSSVEFEAVANDVFFGIMGATVLH